MTSAEANGILGVMRAVNNKILFDEHLLNRLQIDTREHHKYRTSTFLSVMTQ
ncbi:MAG: hypothetical protein M3Q42_06910 [Pseudomonadota bacterium]|nr:hypothetical protein [Pseudomonadota bacterium]